MGVAELVWNVPYDECGHSTCVGLSTDARQQSAQDTINVHAPSVLVQLLEFCKQKRGPLPVFSLFGT